VPSPVSVLLISPPRSWRPDGNFGDSHLVALGSFLEARTGARVEVIDLDYERFLQAPHPERVFGRNFFVVGISCYSSYDYLTAFYLGREIRRSNPSAILVVGGYHPSARPGDFLDLPGSELDEPSPFDHVVVGEGELPLARIVRAAARGEVRLDPRAQQRLMRELRRPAAPEPAREALTERETEVLQHLARGATNKAIAQALGVGEATVKSHVSAVLAKLGLKSRTQAALHALREGWVTRDP